MMSPLWHQPKLGSLELCIPSPEFSMTTRVASIVDDGPDAVVGEWVYNSQGVALPLRVQPWACNYCHVRRAHVHHDRLPNRWPCHRRLVQAVYEHGHARAASVASFSYALLRF